MNKLGLLRSILREAGMSNSQIEKLGRIKDLLDGLSKCEIEVEIEVDLKTLGTKSHVSKYVSAARLRACRLSNNATIGEVIDTEKNITPTASGNGLSHVSDGIGAEIEDKIRAFLNQHRDTIRQRQP